MRVVMAGPSVKVPSGVAVHIARYRLTAETPEIASASKAAVIRTSSGSRVLADQATSTQRVPWSASTSATSVTRSATCRTRGRWWGG